MERCDSLLEIIVIFVVVESQSVGTAVSGEYLHDIFLLTGRQFVVAVMVAIIRAVATAEVVLHFPACLCFLIIWHVVINIGEAPRFLYQFRLVVALTRSILSC